MKFLLTSVFSLVSSFLFCQLPDSDIWLFDIKDSAWSNPPAGRQVSFHNPENITNRKGYDNQPAFSPDGKFILFSSQRDSNGSTDIYRYDLGTKKTTQFTKTPTSEYSPTFMPDGKNISVIMVEKDSTQRLWKFPLSGGPPVCIMKKVDSVGYHSWISRDSVAVYVLTKPAFTLQIVNINLQKAKVIADSIGRCMRMKDRNLWYTTQAGHFNNVYEYSFRSKTSVLKGVIESEDYLFKGKEEIWSCSDNTIVSGYMSSKSGAEEIMNFTPFGITKITRITVSPDGKKLAVVSNK